MAGALAQERADAAASGGSSITPATEAEAHAAAVARLATIATAYESWDARCPGCGGFVPWIDVTDAGFGEAKNKLSLPALDNGQLAWSVVAAAAALSAANEHGLAARYAARLDRMRKSAPVLFLKRLDLDAEIGAGQVGKVAAASKVLDVSSPVSDGNAALATRGRAS